MLTDTIKQNVFISYPNKTLAFRDLKSACFLFQSVAIPFTTNGSFQQIGNLIIVYTPVANDFHISIYNDGDPLVQMGKTTYETEGRIGYYTDSSLHWLIDTLKKCI